MIRNCPFCKEHNSVPYMKPTAWNNRHGIELRKCKPCGFVFSAVSIYEYTAAGTQYLNKTKEDFLKEAAKQQLPALANELLQKTKLQEGKVLDFGCGIGLLALCLQQKKCKTYGIEPSKICLEHHKQLDIVSTDSMEQFATQKNSFDLVIMKDVLEHVDNPVELLQQVVSFVKPGGYFYIRVPNVYHYPFHWSIDTKSHVNHFSPQKLTALLKANNMKRVDFVSVYDVSTRVGKLYNAVFWQLRSFIPLYHQISFLCQRV